MKKVTWADYEENFKKYKKMYDLYYFVDMENVGALNVDLEVRDSFLHPSDFGFSLSVLSEDMDDQVAAWLPDGEFVYLDTSLDEVIESVAEEYHLFFEKTNEEVSSEDLLHLLRWNDYTFISNADPANALDYPDIDEEIRDIVETGDFEEIDKNSEDFFLYAMRMEFITAEQDEQLNWKIIDGFFPDRMFRVGEYRIGLII